MKKTDIRVTMFEETEDDVVTARGALILKEEPDCYRATSVIYEEDIDDLIKLLKRIKKDIKLAKKKAHQK